ncbi:hypothetical protein UH37_21235, partial [Escherichia coli]
SQLAGNLRVILSPTVAIAVLFALFQLGLSLFNLTLKFFKTGTEQHPAQFKMMDIIFVEPEVTDQTV